MGNIPVSLIMFVVCALFYCVIIYVMINYDKTRQIKNLYDIDKYISEQFKDSYCTKLINEGGTFKLVENWLIYYKEGKERTRVMCVQNNNKAYFRYILQDSMESIEQSLKSDCFEM